MNTGAIKKSYNKLILRAFDNEEELSNSDWTFINSIAEMEDHEILTPKQVKWLDDIEEKLDAA
jgi:hypothetical protein